MGSDGYVTSPRYSSRQNPAWIAPAAGLVSTCSILLHSKTREVNYFLTYQTHSPVKILCLPELELEWIMHCVIFLQWNSVCPYKSIS